MLTKFFSQSYIRQHKQDVPWDDISLLYDLNDNFVRQFHKFINWTKVIQQRQEMTKQQRLKYIKDYNLISKVGMNWYGVLRTYWYEQNNDN